MSSIIRLILDQERKLLVMQNDYCSNFASFPCSEKKLNSAIKDRSRPNGEVALSRRDWFLYPYQLYNCERFPSEPEYVDVRQYTYANESIGILWELGRSQGDLEDFEAVLNFLLERGENLNKICGPGGSILHSLVLKAALEYGSSFEDRLTLVLRRGADINLRGPQGTPLQIVWWLLLYYDLRPEQRGFMQTMLKDFLAEGAECDWIESDGSHVNSKEVIALSSLDADALDEQCKKLYRAPAGGSEGLWYSWNLPVCRRPTIKNPFRWHFVKILTDRGSLEASSLKDISERIPCTYDTAQGFFSVTFLVFWYFRQFLEDVLGHCWSSVSPDLGRKLQDHLVIADCNTRLESVSVREHMKLRWPQSRFDMLEEVKKAVRTADELCKSHFLCY